MKTKSTIKNILLAFSLIAILAACKKDKTKDPDPVPPVEVKTITITELRALSTGASVNVPDGRKIKGIVISDVASKNIDAKSVVLQEATDKPSIIANFGVAQTFAIGDEVEIDISKQVLAQINGEIVLQNIPAANAKKTGTGTVTPRNTTIADINANKAAWAGTLVSIDATTLVSTNGKYSGSLTITDAAGTISSAILAGATFENANLLPSVSKVIGIVRLSGTTTSLNIRNTTDVVVGNVTRAVTEDFTTWVAGTPGQTSISVYGFYRISGWPQVPGRIFDASFTTPTKEYPYLFNSHGTASNYRSYFWNIAKTPPSIEKGLKTVTITFAASSATGNLDLAQLSSQVFIGGINVPAFDPSKDVVKIGIAMLANSGVPSLLAATLIRTSASFNEVGKFYTVTFNVPTKEELMAAGVSDANATAQLETPVVGIINLSTRTADPSGFTYAPILIDKIVYGY